MIRVVVLAQEHLHVYPEILLLLRTQLLLDDIVKVELDQLQRYDVLLIQRLLLLELLNWIVLIEFLCERVHEDILAVDGLYDDALLVACEYYVSNLPLGFEFVRAHFLVEVVNSRDVDLLLVFFNCCYSFLDINEGHLGKVLLVRRCLNPEASIQANLSLKYFESKLIAFLLVRAIRSRHSVLCTRQPIILIRSFPHCYVAAAGSILPKRFGSDDNPLFAN